MSNIDPQHYKNHPSGVECIEITQHASFVIGNALKYIWRTEWSDASTEKKVENLKKARWYLAREIQRLEAEK